MTIALGITLVLLLGWSSPAAADPAGPTDYVSEITAIDPAIDGLEWTIIGGDSFIELTVTEPKEVVVIGYGGEPYLRFEPDGTVSENQLSSSVVLNESRFSSAEVAVDPSRDAGVEPDWKVVATNGRYAWHDHRTHWMNPGKPPGAQPGDQILEGVVPVVVDGATVSVQVESYLQSSPSPLAPIIGAIAAIVLGAAAITSVGRFRGALAVALLAAILAFVVGVWAIRSVPAEAGPGMRAWLLPVMAVIAIVVALAGRLSEPTNAALAGFAGLQLIIWGWSKRTGIVRAVLATDAPWPLDRAVTAAALVVGIAAVGVGVHALLAKPTPRSG